MMTKKKAILLNGVGAKTYNLIRNLVAPNKPSDKTFKEIVDLVQKHHSPTPSVIVERFRFNTRVRKAGENIANYVADLRKLTEHCKFNADTLDEMLRDRLVVGINDDAIQKRL